MSRFRRLAPFFVLLAFTTVSLSAQKTKDAKFKEFPFAAFPMLLLDDLVTEQWPVTLPLVNAPMPVIRLNPGQCVRPSVGASGKGNKEFTQAITIAYTVTISGSTTSSAAATPAAVKQIKPDGADFVSGALAAAGIKGPEMPTSSIAASKEKWCAPPTDTEANVEFKILAVTPSGKEKLAPLKLSIIPLSVSAKHKFKDMSELSQWMQSYHFGPEPGRLPAAIQAFTADVKAELIVEQFFIAAFKQQPEYAQPTVDALVNAPSARFTAIFLIGQAGVTLQRMPELSALEKKSLAAMPPLPDPFTVTYDRVMFTKLDMLWSTFSATGRIEPFRSLVDKLAWSSDYQAYADLQKSGSKPTSLDDSLVRALTYSAAGWSLNSFQMHDGLAADYIAAILADPKTPEAIKEELSALGTNPAFKRE